MKIPVPSFSIFPHTHISSKPLTNPNCIVPEKLSLIPRSSASAPYYRDPPLPITQMYTAKHRTDPAYRKPSLWEQAGRSQILMLSNIIL